MRAVIVVVALLACAVGIDAAMQNLALGKPASQSSTGHKGAASRAVDGDTNSDWRKGSCSHTSDAGQQWWSVDLQKVSTVVKVLIYNRLDCCSERLNNVKVKVGMKPDGKGHVCGGIKVAKDKRFLEIICKQAIIGRYVTVYNTVSVLTLCEVEVMGEPYQAKKPHNMALGKKVYQKTTGHGGVATRAVDGNTNTNWRGGSCSHTGDQENQWWQVDLGEAAVVSKVIIYNRQDCCSERLNHVQVRVGGANQSSKSTDHANICGVVENAQGRRKLDITCKRPMVGRFVTVWIPGGALTLCEVKVMAVPKPKAVIG